MVPSSPLSLLALACPFPSPSPCQWVLEALWPLLHPTQALCSSTFQCKSARRTLLTAWIQKSGSGETMTSRLLCECTLLHGSSELNILRGRMKLIIQTAKSPCSLGEVHERLCQADLPEHPVPRNSPFFGRVEQNVRLFFCIFVIVGGFSARAQGRVIDCQIYEIGRNPSHGRGDVVRGRRGLLKSNVCRREKTWTTEHAQQEHCTVE